MDDKEEKTSESTPYKSDVDEEAMSFLPPHKKRHIEDPSQENTEEEDPKEEHTEEEHTEEDTGEDDECSAMETDEGASGQDPHEQPMEIGDPGVEAMAAPAVVAGVEAMAAPAVVAGVEAMAAPAVVAGVEAMAAPAVVAGVEAMAAPAVVADPLAARQQIINRIVTPDKQNLIQQLVQHYEEAVALLEEVKRIMRVERLFVKYIIERLRRLENETE